MHVSEARLNANRMNSAKSTGPKTEEGKAISRRNGLKHGMAGEGVVLPEEDAEKIARRVEDLTADMRPQSTAGVILIAQMATLSVRAERSALHEFAATAKRVRHAADDFDERRIEEAAQLFAELGENVRGNLRKLRKSPEGIDVLIEAWRDLRADLAISPLPVWTVEHLEKAASLTGVKAQHAPGTWLGALSRACWGDFEGIGKGAGGGLDDESRRAWARTMLFELIDGEVAGLEAHSETLDHAIIEADRAEAGARALFDPSRDATLARRYEAESYRGFFKALKEFRQVEAEAAVQVEAAPPRPTASRVASSREMPRPPDREASRGFPDAPEADPTVVRGSDGQPFRVGRAPNPPG